MDGVKEFLPGKLPGGWRMLVRCADGAGYVSDTGLIVVANEVREYDGERWLHVSCSHERQTPTLGELQYVKQVFVGAERTAFQVLPPPVTEWGGGRRCFHLWASLCGRPFPGVLRR